MPKETNAMSTFITDIATPISTFLVTQIGTFSTTIMETPLLAMTVGILLVGTAVGFISRLIRR